MADKLKQQAVVAFITDVAGVASPSSPAPHVGLIGRNFLQHVRFVYDGPKGQFEIVDYRASGKKPALAPARRKTLRQKQKTKSKRKLRKPRKK